MPKDQMSERWSVSCPGPAPGHVHRRADRGALARELRLRSELRETEVDDLRQSVARYENVPRLDVAVSDSLFVGLGKSRRYLDRDLRRLF